MYKVRLTNFEGPLDLLLFFIKRDELDIYDIPIAYITKEFLDTLHLMQQLDLDVAGEFIVMAATLMQIKVRMLLPREVTEEEEEDPRAELVRRLLEYKRYKEMAGEIQKMEVAARRLRFRRFFEYDPKDMGETEDNDLLKDMTLFDLITAFKFALDHMPQRSIHEVQKINITVDEQTVMITDALNKSGDVTFLSLVSSMNEKIRVVVTFIALLELVKQRVVTVRQLESYREILISKILENNSVAQESV
jgi:segregation and condensation protein A